MANLPGDVRYEFGHGLWQVQLGETPENAKPLPQFGFGIFELKADLAGDTFRSVYAVKLLKGVYVLHVFKKKSKSGRAMAREDIVRIEARLKRAREIDREN